MIKMSCKIPKKVYKGALSALSGVELPVWCSIGVLKRGVLLLIYQKVWLAKGGIYHTSKTVRSRSPTQECFNICRLRSNIKYKTLLQKLIQEILHFVLSSLCQIHLKYVKILNKHKLFFSLGNNGQTHRREMDNGFNHYI